MKDSQFKLALVRYIYDRLGYTVTEKDDPFSDIADYLQDNATWNSEGQPQTRWFDAGLEAFVKSVENSKLDESKYMQLDQNISQYLSKINRERNSPLQLRYYQYIAVFFTELVLDELDRGVFLQNFNDFIDEEFWQFDEDVLQMKDFSKIAYWMATGSGKTHIMHINMLQVNKYFDEDKYDNLILIASNKNVAKQHIEELEKHGIPYERLSNENNDSKVIKVTDINKLKKGESGPKTVDVEELGQQNIIFVDEGHKGLGSISSSSLGWIEKRDYLIGATRDSKSLQREGFAFEYSATFASSLSNAEGYQEYSRSIVIDYPYGRFHKDGTEKITISLISLQKVNFHRWSEMRRVNGYCQIY